MTTTPLHSATIGAHVHRIARALVPLVAFVYVAGYALGDWIHWANDCLVGRGRQRWAAPARPRPVALLQPGAAQPLPVRSRNYRLNAFTVAELRKEAARMGLPRTLYTRGRRAELIQALCTS